MPIHLTIPSCRQRERKHQVRTCVHKPQHTHTHNIIQAPPSAPWQTKQYGVRDPSIQKQYGVRDPSIPLVNAPTLSTPTTSMNPLPVCVCVCARVRLCFCVVSRLCDACGGSRLHLRILQGKRVIGDCQQISSPVLNHNLPPFPTACLVLLLCLSTFPSIVSRIYREQLYHNN